MATTDDAQQLATGRRQRNYVNAHAYHWHWEGENTTLEEDSNTFIKIAHLLGFPDPKVDVIRRDSASPGFDLKLKIMSLLNRAYLEPGNSVILLHYAGRAAVNHINELEFISPFGTKIAAQGIMIDIVSDYVIPFGAGVDVVIIMDCCYPNLLTHAQPGDRRVDILAAGDYKDPAVSGSHQALSFTSKIYMDLQERARQGSREVEMAQLITSLRDRESQIETPTYLAKLGPGSVTLLIVSQTPSSAPPPPPSYPSPGLLATFTMHTSDPLTTTEVDDILRSISPIPEEQASNLKIDQVKRTSTNSTLIILESPLSTFYRIAGLPGVNLICENYPMLPA